MPSLDSPIANSEHSDLGAQLLAMKAAAGLTKRRDEVVVRLEGFTAALVRDVPNL